jgi:hypothetical protein
METLDYLRSGAQEPPQAIIALFARPRNAQGYEPQPGLNDEWALISRVPKVDAGADEAAAIAEEEHPSGTVFGPDEVSLESISMALAKGPVAIRVTDEQARRIMARHRRDAFPPE